MRFFLIFWGAFLATSALADLYVLVDGGLKRIMYFQSDPAYVQNSGKGRYVIPLTEWQYTTGWENLPPVTQSNLFNSAYSNYHAAKSDLLKVSENATVEFLWRAGYLSTNLVSVPSGTRTSVMTNLIALGRANPTNPAVDNLISRFHSCLDLLVENGGTLEDSVWHPGL